ncbi:hypothetical protein SLEP1_g59269 [Rubroshorea leprosula]|uniref:Reverse transcriptase domain-containing protein n=1 Tax=Rubroshorea leprosula TaxID=152421 RepID=A0AAV5MTD2_9ROSI|nr:hypothetical protein SLEP1_g59269 [Rubroshorea leprosula]
MVQQEHVNFLMIQESKVEVANDQLCRSIWGQDCVEWCAKSSDGRAGGLLCLWDPNLFERIKVFEGDGFLGVEASWGKNKSKCCFLNVYGPCNVAGRAKLWEDLSRLIEAQNCFFCIGGDFNYVRGSHERKDDDILKRKDGFEEVWFCLKKKESLWRQKSRATWIKEGDANTGFFHRIVNGRRKKNMLWGIDNHGSWIDDPIQLKQIIMDHFRNQLSSQSCQQPRPYLQHLQFSKLNEEDKITLEEEFSNDEIRDVVFSCASDKAPGLDGLNFHFVKTIWGTIEGDVINFIKEFHQNGKLVKGLNSSYIMLVPKKKNPTSLKEFRPISMVGCLYKILAKVLANRLQKVIGKVISRGLRQGDPLSPYLFLIAAEGLYALLLEAETKDMLKGVMVDENTSVSHLQFADDTALLCGASTNSVWAIKCTLRCMAALALNCKAGKLPFTYLGLPIGGNPHRHSFWKLVVAKFRSKLASWKGKLLSFGGRITLLMSVLSALPLFYFSVFKSKATLAKSKRGLGIPNLAISNIALLGKWWNKFYNDGENEKLWKKIVISKYYAGSTSNLIYNTMSSRLSSLWKDILSIDKVSDRATMCFSNGFTHQLGDGSKTSFWKDIWLESSPLKHEFPRLFSLTLDKELLVADLKPTNREGWNL